MFEAKEASLKLQMLTTGSVSSEPEDFVFLPRLPAMGTGVCMGPSKRPCPCRCTWGAGGPSPMVAGIVSASGGSDILAACTVVMNRH